MQGLGCVRSDPRGVTLPKDVARQRPTVLTTKGNMHGTKGGGIGAPPEWL
jgi:hypothetical protein